MKSVGRQIWSRRSSMRTGELLDSVDRWRCTNRVWFWFNRICDGRSRCSTVQSPAWKKTWFHATIKIMIFFLYTSFAIIPCVHIAYTLHTRTTVIVNRHLKNALLINDNHRGVRTQQLSKYCLKNSDANCSQKQIRKNMNKWTTKLQRIGFEIKSVFKFFLLCPSFQEHHCSMQPGMSRRNLEARSSFSLLLVCLCQLILGWHDPELSTRMMTWSEMVRDQLTLESQYQMLERDMFWNVKQSCLHSPASAGAPMNWLIESSSMVDWETSQNPIAVVQVTVYESTDESVNCVISQWLPDKTQLTEMKEAYPHVCSGSVTALWFWFQPPGFESKWGPIYYTIFYHIVDMRSRR